MFSSAQSGQSSRLIHGVHRLVGDTLEKMEGQNQERGFEGCGQGTRFGRLIHSSPRVFIEQLLCVRLSALCPGRRGQQEEHSAWHIVEFRNCFRNEEMTSGLEVEAGRD